MKPELLKWFVTKIVNNVYVKKLIKKLLPYFSDSIYNQVSYAYLHLKLCLYPPQINLIDPQRFNEKIIWLKTRYHHPNATLYADKIEVKEFIKRTVGLQYVIPTLSVFNHADEIDFQTLPQSFVLKANHGSGWNVIVYDKRSVDIHRIKKNLQIWLNKSYYKESREYQYRDILPRILAEELLRPNIGEQLNDYKFFCFNGKPAFVQVDMNRFTEHQRNFYSPDWERLPFTILYPSYADEIPKPSKLNEMLKLAEILSQGFPFIRIDLYECKQQIYFGELTFHPEGGCGPIQPPEWDITLGAMLRLPTPNR